MSKETETERRKFWNIGSVWHLVASKLSKLRQKGAGGTGCSFYGNGRQKHTKFNELQKAAKVPAARFTPRKMPTRKAGSKLRANGKLQPATFNLQPASCN